MVRGEQMRLQMKAAAARAAMAAMAAVAAAAAAELCAAHLELPMMAASSSLHHRFVPWAMHASHRPRY